MVEITRSFEIDIEAIDDDHRRLVDIVNEIVQALDDAKPEVCRTLVPEFVDLAKQHFSREETLLAKYSYPDLEKHRRHHAALDGKMETMLSLAENAVDSPPAQETLRKELIFFIMDDVINEDMDYKSFLVAATAKDD
jgi:hemerythrin-like metal-binding protein